MFGKAQLIRCILLLLQDNGFNISIFLEARYMYILRQKTAKKLDFLRFLWYNYSILVMCFGGKRYV